VYLSNGTHMSHSDYHRYKQDIRNELAIVHQKEFKDSLEVLAITKQEQQQLEQELFTVQQEVQFLQYEIAQEKDSMETDWEKHYRESVAKNNDLKSHLNKHAFKLYSQLALLPIFIDYQNDKGIKFIIQKNYKTDEYRFCFDPYEIQGNAHSMISQMYKEQNWGTINGGWLKVIDNVVTLYAQSGDYGVYNNDIAIECAKSIFPNKTIKSFAGVLWEEIQ
jgi:hypothetical protein